MTDLTTLADEYYDYVIRTSHAARIWDGKLPYLERWDDYSADAVAAHQARLRDFAARAEAIVVDPSDKYAFALQQSVAMGARGEADDATWRAELFEPNPKFGLTEMVFSFVDNYPLATAEHGEAYLEKFRRMPAALADLAEAIRAGAAQGRVALASHLRATADGIDTYLTTPSGPDERLAAQAPPTELNEAAAQQWRDARATILADAVRPALAAYAAALREVATVGRPDDKPGLCHLPGGVEAYAKKVFATTLTDHTPEQIHALGLAKIAALEDEYRDIAGPIVGSDDIDEIYARLRDDPTLRYRTSEAIVADAEIALARATAEAPAWFARVPQSPCKAVATPYGAMAYYSGPDPSSGKEAAFYFNASDPSAWATYELEAITFHEAIPGHHFQLALLAEDPTLHVVQREFFNTANAEGWGLYAERLADEMGLYSSAIARVGMLSADSLRACRLVVDTGLHALGWSRDQAIDFMLAHSPLDRGHIEPEVDRYIGMPAQAVAYMIGRIEIESIRAEAEARPGFDIREFHDRLLRYGGVPLPTLRVLALTD